MLDEFIYPNTRAIELAQASNVAVPALAVDVAGEKALATAPIVAIMPDKSEVPVTAVIQTTPVEHVATMAGGEPAQLPKTASGLPLLVLFGVDSLLLAFGFADFTRRRAVPIL